jgi:hypothetical protein
MKTTSPSSRINEKETVRAETVHGSWKAQSVAWGTASQEHAARQNDGQAAWRCFLVRPPAIARGGKGKKGFQGKETVGFVPWEQRCKMPQHKSDPQYGRKKARGKWKARVCRLTCISPVLYRKSLVLTSAPGSPSINVPESVYHLAEERKAQRAMSSTPVFHLFFTGKGLRVRPRKGKKSLDSPTNDPVLFLRGVAGGGDSPLPSTSENYAGCR